MRTTAAVVVASVLLGSVVHSTATDAELIDLGVPTSDQLSASSRDSTRGVKTIKDHSFDKDCTYAWGTGGTSYCLMMVKDAWPQDQWGCTNKLTQSTTLTLYRKQQANCAMADAQKVGTADVVLAGGSVHITINLLAGWTLKEARIHVGSYPLPAASQQWVCSPYYKTWLVTDSTKVTLPLPGSRIWVAVYVEVCHKCDAVDADATLVKVIKTEGDWNNGANSLPPAKVQEGMLGWTLDDMVPTLHHFPAVYLHPGVRVFFPEQGDGIAAGYKFRFHCPENCDNLPCEVIVTHYHCPPCSGDTNGKLPGLLPADGWESGWCSPKFRYLSYKHDMTAFRKLVPAGATEDTPAFEHVLSNTAVYVRPGAVDCAQFEDKLKCTKHDDECVWEDGECVSNWCPPVPRGPPRKCDPCAPTRAD